MNPADTPPKHALQAPFTFSQSSLQDYVDCPRRFELRYLAQTVWPAVEAEPVSEAEDRQRQGLFFHRLVQQHILGLPAGKLQAMASTRDLARWWSNYVSAGPDLAGLTLLPEVTLSTKLGDHRLVAKYDLLAIGTGGVTIFDWKTSARRPREEWLAGRWQTRVYRALVATAGSELNQGNPLQANDISMVYWFADFPSEPARFAYDQQQFSRDWSAIESLVNEISNAPTFPLTADTRLCRFCVYRSLCDRGASAGPWQEAEDESAPGNGFELDYEQIAEIEF